MLDIYEASEALLMHATKRAKEIGVPMVMAVVDEGGNLVAFKRMKDSLLVSVDVAQGKAFTALALDMPTDEVAKIITPGGPIYGMQVTNKGRIVAFGGGFPLYVEGKRMGGFGMSGGSVEEDMDCAQYAISQIEGLETK
ncbi:MAG: heme-binding protein [Solobacterium sp.]|nr:heme-binding protein [Solobacterium sp.]